MLVILSDLHFTDASLSAGDNIPARAFAYLAEDIRGIIENQDAGGRRRLDVKNVEILLLGDVFDLIRSTRWDALLPPWSTPGAKLEDRAGKVLDGILAHRGQTPVTVPGTDTGDRHRGQAPVTVPGKDTGVCPR